MVVPPERLAVVRTPFRGRALAAQFFPFAGLRVCSPTWPLPRPSPRNPFGVLLREERNAHPLDRGHPPANGPSRPARCASCRPRSAGGLTPCVACVSVVTGQPGSTPARGPDRILGDRVVDASCSSVSRTPCSGRRAVPRSQHPGDAREFFPRRLSSPLLRHRRCTRLECARALCPAHREVHGRRRAASVVAGQSRNTGAQALAVTMRGLALREIRLRHWAALCVKSSAPRSSMASRWR
jgi:hypothetical protein